MSVFLAYGVLAGLIAPAGLLAQDQPTAPDPPAQDGPATQPQSTPPPAPVPAPAPPPPAAKPAPPKTVAVSPIAVASSAGSVSMKNIAFSPASVTVNVGDTVTWTNADQVTHTVTSKDGSFDLGNVKPRGSVSHAFTRAGTVGYICTIHPGMNGTVKVVAASNGGNQGSTPSGGNAGSSSGTSSGTSSSATSGSNGGLPATGVDAGGLLIVGLGFLALGLFARRRAAS